MSYAAPGSFSFAVPQVTAYSCPPTGPVVAPMPIVGNALSYTIPQVPVVPTLSQDAQRTILNAAFNVMDVNNDGKINSQEFAAIMNKPASVSHQPGNAALPAPSVVTSYGAPTFSYSIPAGAASWASPTPVPCGAPTTTYGAPATIGYAMPTIGTTTFGAPTAELTALTYTAPPQAVTITKPASFVPHTTYAMPGTPTVLAQPSVPVGSVCIASGQATIPSSSIAASAADSTSVTFPAGPPTTTSTPPVTVTSVPVTTPYVAPTTFMPPMPPAVSYALPAVTSTHAAPIMSTICAAPMSATTSGPSVSVTAASGEMKQEVMEPAITYNAPAATLATTTPVVTYTAPASTMTAAPVTAAPIVASSVEANAFPVVTSTLAEQPLNFGTPIVTQVMSNVGEQPVTPNFVEQPVTYASPVVTQVQPLPCVTPVTSTVIEQPVTSTVMEQPVTSTIFEQPKTYATPVVTGVTQAPVMTYTSPGTAVSVAEYSATAPVAVDACGPSLSAYPTTSMSMAVPSMTYSAPVTMAPASYAVATGSTPVGSYGAASPCMGMSLGGPVVTPAVSAAPMPANLMAPAIVVNSAFNALDRNHDGMITRSEFNAALSQR